MNDDEDVSACSPAALNFRFNQFNAGQIDFSDPLKDQDEIDLIGVCLRQVPEFDIERIYRAKKQRAVEPDKQNCRTFANPGALNPVLLPFLPEI